MAIWRFSRRWSSAILDVNRTIQSALPSYGQNDVWRYDIAHPDAVAEKTNEMKAIIRLQCREICTHVRRPPTLLTLWLPLLPYGYSSKHHVPDRVKPSFVIFRHPGTLTLRTERQSARMSKITNDSLTRSGTVCFIAYPCGNSGRQRVNNYRVAQWKTARFLRYHVFAATTVIIMRFLLKCSEITAEKNKRQCFKRVLNILCKLTGNGLRHRLLIVDVICVNMPVLTSDDKALIKVLQVEKSWNVDRMMRECPARQWKRQTLYDWPDW